jgi:hypothetical protein
MPGLGPVDASPRSAGIRARSQRKGQALASELGTDHLDPIPDEPDPVLHAGDDHALEPGERRGTLVGSVGAAVNAASPTLPEAIKAGIVAMVKAASVAARKLREWLRKRRGLRPAIPWATPRIVRLLVA